MQILKQEPPNFEQIKKAFPDAVASKGVIFAYAGDIYNPFALPIGPQNVAHEQVHFIQQEEMGVDAWWDEYIANPEFRAQQELPAYRAEYQYLKDHSDDREKLARAARHMASSLSGANYGFCISFSEALQSIL